jgi:LysM repeat protein
MNPMMQPPIGMMNRQPSQNNMPVRAPMPPGIPNSPMPPAVMGQWSPPQAPQYIKTMIQKGDTLSALAKRHGTTVSSLMYLNGIKDADTIYANKEIMVPNPRFPKMQPGMTMGGQNPALAPAGATQSMRNGPQNPRGMPQELGPDQVNDAMMQMLPAGKAATLGAGALGALMPKAIQKLGQMAPRMAQAGKVDAGMMRKAFGARGDMPLAMNNVRPTGGNAQGMAAAMLSSPLNRVMAGRGSIPAGSIDEAMASLKNIPPGSLDGVMGAGKKAAPSLLDDVMAGRKNIPPGSIDDVMASRGDIPAGSLDDAIASINQSPLAEELKSMLNHVAHRSSKW